MTLTPIAEVKTAEQARDIAIDWQHTEDVSDVSQLSYSELADFGYYFEQLADKFPELKDEFKENGII